MERTVGTPAPPVGEEPVLTGSQATVLQQSVPAALLLAGCALWLVSLPRIDPDRMTDLGLVSVLPLATFAALSLLTLSFAITIASQFQSRRYFRLLMAAEIFLLVMILYGTPALVEVVPRSGTVWQHLGVADYVARHGAVDRTIDAYFNWPGFFIGLAFLQKVTGVTSLAGIGAWAPVFFNVVGALVLVNVFRFSFRDERLACVGVWVFLITNWIGQDILSPQAFGYLTYLCIVLLLFVTAPAVRTAGPLRRLVARAAPALTSTRWRRSPPSADALAVPPPEGWPRTRPQLVLTTLTIVGLFGGVAISHQLTPYALLAVVSGLVIANVSNARALPLLMALIIFTWFTYEAVPFLQQFLHQETQSFGEVRQNFSASVTERVSGTREHQLVVYLRLVMTGEVWGLAILSAITRYWRGYRDTRFVVLGVAPFLLAALQSYGGEIALRIYLFTLPAAAFFITALLVPAIDRWAARRVVVAITALSFAFLPLFLVSRYGNERIDYYAPGEYAAVKELYRISRPGSVFFVLAPNLPWRWQRYADDRQFPLYEYVRVYARHLSAAPGTVANTMTGDSRPTYLIFTRAQTPFATYVRGVSPEAVMKFERLIARSPRFRRIYHNPTAVIYRAVPRRGK
jgi:hypothetical protein